MPYDILCRMEVFRLEILIFLVIALFALRFSRHDLRRLNVLLSPLQQLALRPGISILVVALIAFCGSALVSLTVRFPEPAIHDEFSYLLSADTFTSGRLTNPSHALWKHFQSFHVIQQPTYASKYPPGQGLALALGKLIGGHQVVGLWLSAAFACGCICWMLQAWVPYRWALLGGFLSSLNLGFFGYWSQRYWGGLVAAAGGALLYGALRRLLRRPSPGSAAVLGLGLLILANSRPLEGLIVSIPAGVLFLHWFLRTQDLPWAVRVRRVLLPLCAILALGFLWMGYYNYRVTGDPLRMPYQEYHKDYAFVPLFLWEQPKPVPHQMLEVFKVFNYGLLKSYQNQRTLLGYAHYKLCSLIVIVVFFCRFVFLIPLATLPWATKNRWVRLALIAIVLVSGFAFLELQTLPRKLAPATGLIMFLIVQGLRHLKVCSWRDKPIGAYLSLAVPFVCVVSVATSFSPSFHIPPLPPSHIRADMLTALDQDPDRHLIIVRYSPNHNPHFEWVYNEADIDGAKVVWARELDRMSNQRLLRYYRDRKAWLLEADKWQNGKLELVPYPVTPRLEHKLQLKTF